MAAPLSVGVIGAGGIAQPHVAAWRRLGAPVTIHSLEGAEALAAQHGAATAATLDELLDRCDVVDVCTPTFAHDEFVIAAARAGKNVVCEKPLARTHAKAVAMIEACRGAGVQLYPGQVVRFFPEYATAKAAVDAGRIGRPAVLRFSRRGAAPSRAWFADSALSGGIIVDQMIHDLDYARWVAGDVRQVYAKVTGGDGQPTTAYVILTHTSGALTHAIGGWGHPKTVFRTSFSLSGDTGLLEHDSSAAPTLAWDVPSPTGEGGTLLPNTSLVESPFLTELREFAAAFAGGPPPRVSAEDGLAALDIGLAAAESARVGRPVTLPFTEDAAC
jgi:myo-inositol 2-dehydrogenase/D-chiro-inositol 1-dehydrogenase